MGKSEVFDTIFSIMKGSGSYLLPVCSWLLSQFYPGLKSGRSLVLGMGTWTCLASQLYHQ